MRQVLPLRLHPFARRLTASLLAASFAASLGACTREPSSSTASTRTAVASEAHALTGAAPGTSTSGSFVVSVDGVTAGRASDSIGGYQKGIVERQGRADRHFKKRVHTSTYEPFVLTMPADLSTGLSAWVKDSWSHPGEGVHDGSVAAVDINGRVNESVEFFDADITEVRFPAFDSTLRNEGQLAIKIAPGSISRGQATGNEPPPRPRSWVVSNFALDIDGVDTRHVMKIDAFTIKLPTDTQTAVDFPNLVVTLPKAYASTWITWANTFLGSTPTTDSSEVSGELRLLASDRRTVIATISLDHVGIVRVSDTPAASRPEGSIDTVQVELYVEAMEYNPHPVE
jgi:hypothetical protein